jgi:hypothetical protein
MTELRRALATLLAEEQPLAQRLDSAYDAVYGMGKNVACAILLVAHPDKYGVWNNRSEAQMKQLGIWPDFDRGDSFGKRYVKVNQVLLRVRQELQIDLWTGRTVVVLGPKRIHGVSDDPSGITSALNGDLTVAMSNPTRAAHHSRIFRKLDWARTRMRSRAGSAYRGRRRFALRCSICRLENRESSPTAVSANRANC